MKKAALEWKDFNTYVGDVHYFHHIYGIHNEYEIAFEPCDHGFCVALYDRSRVRTIIGKRICTKSYGYEDDRLHERVRSDEVWGLALEIADQLIEKRLPKGIERL